MQKILDSNSIRSALTGQGMTQKQLAKSVGVSPQAVTNWLKGTDFPRPSTLLKLASTLGLTFAQMVQAEDIGRPVIAFRKKGNARTTPEHVIKAQEIGMLLKPLVSYLPEVQTLRRLITSPSTDYQKLQTIASQTRAELGVGEQAVLEYQHLIGEFKSCGAILIPVLWGEKGSHENAMHIRLPTEDVTFIFLNLDTKTEDFKFWMAHELAHVYTPELSGSDQGEDFADAFAGALLFPRACAEAAYSDVMKYSHTAGMLKALSLYADRYVISIYSVFREIKHFAKAFGLPGPAIEDRAIHAYRNSTGGQLVSEALFKPLPPSPSVYIAAFEHSFNSDFFKAVRRMICENDTGPSYLQQILRVPLVDALVLHKELHD